MSQISLLAVDLDGTLLTRQGTLAPEGVGMLRRAQRAGVRVIVSTTRTPGSVCAFCREIGIADPIICTSGAQVWGSPDGPVWASHTFEREVALAIARLADERGWELCTTVDPTTYWRRRPGQALGPYSSRVTVVSSNVAGVVGDPVRILVTQVAAIEGVRALCRERFADRCLYEVYAGADGVPHSLGVFAPGATKGVGLALVMERLEVEREAVLAIGDNACDLAMYPHAGVAVVMDNAPDEIKQRALEMGAIVAPSNDDEGVAWAVRRYVFGCPPSVPPARGGEVRSSPGGRGGSAVLAPWNGGEVRSSPRGTVGEVRSSPRGMVGKCGPRPVERWGKCGPPPVERGELEGGLDG